ncbi:M20/M25/M40 family metallo-hydrolase [Phormidium nigroviride]
MELKERLYNHLTQIVRDRNPYFASAGHFYVQQYIRQQLEQWGNVELDEFEVRGKVHHNLILSLPGGDPPFKKAGSSHKLHPILIGAHYDTVPGSPGADDNGTGLAVLLELASAIASQPLKYPVQLIAFDMEEYGCFGSDRYAAKLQAENQPLRLMIALEMLGYYDDTPNSQSYPTGLKYFYPNCGNFIALIGNLRTIPDMISLSRNIRQSGSNCEWLPVPYRGLIVPDTRRSDHAPFWDRGYRAIMVTDTANMRNPHYHQKSDKIDTLNLDFLAAVCQGLEVGIRCL